MYELLSERCFPSNRSFVYPSTTIQCRNRLNVLVISFLDSFLDERRAGSELDLASFIIRTLYSETGEGTYDPNNMYGLSNIKSLLEKADDRVFFDYIDIIIQASIEYNILDANSRQVFFDDVNYSLKRSGMDLCVLEGKLVRMSDPEMMESVVEPAFMELNRCGFINAHTNLLDAFSFFKEEDYENAIHSAHKALESTIDYIMDRNDLKSEKDKIPSKLIVLIENSVLPEEYRQSVNSLVDVLQSSSIVRNRCGGHGTSKETEVDSLYVKYAIDSVASSILFLIRLYNKNKRRL